MDKFMATYAHVKSNVLIKLIVYWDENSTILPGEKFGEFKLPTFVQEVAIAFRYFLIGHMAGSSELRAKIRTVL